MAEHTIEDYNRDVEKVNEQANESDKAYNSCLEYLKEKSDELTCRLNQEDLVASVAFMAFNTDSRGRYKCNCKSRPCPCGEWKKRIERGDAKTGDMCYCELFIKV